MTLAGAGSIWTAALLAAATLVIGFPERWPQAAIHAGIFALGLVWALRAVIRPAEFHWNLLVTAMASAVAWGLAQLLLGTSVYAWETGAAVLHWTALLVIAAASSWFCRETHARRRFLRLFLIFGMLVAATTLLPPALAPARLLSTVSAAQGDFFGPFQNRNNYAAFVELLLPVAIWQALSDRGRAWLGWSAAALLYATVIASGSRAGALLVTAEVAVCFTIAWFRDLAPRRQLVSGALLWTAMGAGFTVVAGWGLLWQRLHIPDPLQYRREMMRSTLAMIAERPWSGFGLGTFETAYPRFALFDSGLIVNYAHNDWLQWAAEGGLPLLAMLAAIAIWSVRPAVRNLWGLGVVFVCLHALVDFPLQRLGVAGWAFAILGALAAALAGDAEVTKSRPRQPLRVQKMPPVEQQRSAHGLG